MRDSNVANAAKESAQHEFPLGLHDLGIMSPSDLRPAVGRLAMDTKGVGIVALDRPSTRDALAEVVESGIRVVTLLSDVPAALRSADVGLDNTVAGRTAALLMGRLLDRGSGRGLSRY
jgi:LacI family transcriptional regulator